MNLGSIPLVIAALLLALAGAGLIGQRMTIGSLRSQYSDLALKAANDRVEWIGRVAAANKAHNALIEESRQRERALEHEIQETRRETDRLLTKVREDANSAHAAAEQLLNRARATAAAAIADCPRPGSADPAAVAAGEATAAASMHALLDVLGAATDEAGAMAANADVARAGGLLCEAEHDAAVKHVNPFGEGEAQ